MTITAFIWGYLFVLRQNKLTRNELLSLEKDS